VSEQRFVIIDDGRAVDVLVDVDGGHVRVPAAEAPALGWALKPEGLCWREVCVPLAPAVLEARGLDLARAAAALCRPIAVDLEERAAYLGAPVEDRCRDLASLEAPDFTLPDLDGRLHSLRDQRGRKVMLVAYASW
jgi:hypothetical protein